MEKCDFCGEKAKYDAPTIHGSWAYMCEACSKIAGANLNIGTVLKEPKMEKVDIYYDAAAEQEWAESLTMDELEQLVFDSVAPTACPEGCEVEPDGRCCHGYKSPLLVLGLI